MIKAVENAATNEASWASREASTRDRILEVAIECFSAHGFDGATTRMIAGRAGVNVGLIKYYFDSKERLWREAADRTFAALRLGLGLAPGDLRDLAPLDALRVVIRRYVRFIAQNPASVRFLHDEGTRDSARMRWLVDRHLRPVYEEFGGLVANLQEDGLLPPATDFLHLFYFFVGASSALFHQAPECRYLTGRDPRDPEVADAHADALLTLLLGGAREPRGRSARKKRS